jgi:hypothetical protein
MTIRGCTSVSALVRLLDEVIQHPFSDLEIGDDAVPQRFDHHEVSGRAPQHFLGGLADCLYRARVLIDGDAGRLVHHDPSAPDLHAGVHRPQVNRQVAGKQAQHGPQVFGRGSRYPVEAHNTS